MISKKMEKALNKQLNLELFSAYSYAAMAAWCEKENLSGFAHWMQLQTREEVEHAQKFFVYLLDQDANVNLEAIGKPEGAYNSPEHVFEVTLGHEQTVTKSIHKLVELAIDEKDYATHTFLQWFVTEQVEEEATADSVLQQVRMAGQTPGGLFLLDRELGSRQAGAGDE